ncbi:hypothetical protein SDC9_79973 [bioreactor metagenome]|uniref:SLH domain-containing protein n=1 Tax=bioreactor metagenome TaxID=1076179 RepID=A0A644YZC6_9ZZZZ
MAPSYKGSNGKPAIDVAAVSSGSIINAILNSAISASANTYLQCNGNTLMLPAKYESFAFSAAAASQIKAYSDQLCNTNVGNILQTSNSSSSISVTALGTSPANVTPVKLQTVYAASVTVRKNGAIWTAVTPVIQLSTLSTSLSGAITGTLLNGVYSFTGLDTSKTYYVWDITNNYYTGRSVTSASPSTTVNYYDLTVNLDGGSGATVSGSYASGVTVSIDAGTKSDYTFNSWTSSASGTFGNASNASTTFTMPGNATTITATWTQNTYDLTVNLDGGSGATVSGSYASGVAVSIDAGTKSGYTFNSWTSSASGTFGNASNTATTFTMPGNATTITATWTLNGGGGGGGYSSPANNNTKVIVDNKDYSIGTENKNNQSTTATVDQGKLTAEIAKASDSSSVIFPVSANTNVTAQLVVKNVEDMAKKDMILTVQTGNVSYNLNTSAIDTSKITAALGTTDTNGIPFNVSIANSTAVVNGATVVVSPVEFKITAEYNGITISVDTFSCFVNRIIEITAEQASKITTAVVVQPDGSIRHVPTKVTVVNGKYYAVINSLTNSTYTAVWHPIEFSDVAASWAKASINDMGSRMIVTGVGNNHYEPERDITRAEFAAIVVRALGLAPGTGKSAFSDVDSGAWYCGYIATASAYGIVQGYSATTFGPNDAISREQAMTMLSRAVEIAGIKPELSDSDISALIEKYSDGTAASDYAKPSIGVCLKTGIITGRTSRELAPKDCITRAEVAVVVQRLLQKSELI